MRPVVFFVALLPLLTGCDVLKDRMGIPDPAKVEAEGKAVGGACRHAGRGLEDCYRLNPSADKSSVFVGWKEMNEYMIKNNMQAVAPEVPIEKPSKPKKKPKDDEEVAEEPSKSAGKADAAEKNTAKDAHEKAAAGH